MSGPDFAGHLRDAFGIGVGERWRAIIASYRANLSWAADVDLVLAHLQAECLGAVEISGCETAEVRAVVGPAAVGHLLSNRHRARSVARDATRLRYVMAGIKAGRETIRRSPAAIDGRKQVDELTRALSWVAMTGARFVWGGDRRCHLVDSSGSPLSGRLGGAWGPPVTFAEPLGAVRAAWAVGRERVEIKSVRSSAAHGDAR